MTQPREPGPAKASWHYQRAGAFRQLADDLIEQSHATPYRAEILADTAGALIYEAAKQGINAVANLRGRDPQDNRAKMAEINRIIAEGLTQSDLRSGSQGAWELHIHADQGNLMPERFTQQLANATAFIDEMQAIYRNLTLTG